MINPDSQYAGGIEVFNKLDFDSASFIADTEKDLHLFWKPATTDGYNQNNSISNLRTNKVIKLTEIAETGVYTAKKLHNFLADIFEPYLESYLYRYKILGVEYFHEYYSILKYEKDDYFDTHVDALPGGNNRFVSCLLYLNDNYQGGHIEFPYFNLQLKMPKNSLLVFPSYFSHAHRACKVESGTKYVAVSWLKLKTKEDNL